MLETKQQKTYFATVIVLIVILTLVSLWDRSSFRYVDEPLPPAPQFNTAAYLAYLNSIHIDEAASRELFQQIISEQDIRREMEAELKTDQPVVQPVVDEKSLTISGVSGKEAVVDYLARSTGFAINLASRVDDPNAKLFTDDREAAAAGLAEFQNLSPELWKLDTPKEAVGMQKSLVAMYASYGKILELSKQYATNEKRDPWPEIYREYAVINEQARRYNDELKKSVTAYKLSEAEIQPYFVQKTGHSRFALVKRANAFLGIGDVTITVGDIPRIVKEAVEEGLTTAFAQFMGQFLQKVIGRIESNYLIANFLYYSDALVAGQYVDDYLEKYVSDTLDRQIVKKFVPQLTCGSQPQNLRPVFQAKAQEYLGFDPTTVSPNDPEYYSKMTRVGSFLSTPTGWQTYYEDLAQQATTEAEKAAERELTSPGLKTPRDTLKSSIAISVNNIVSAQKASLEAAMQLGIGTAKNFVSGMVSSLTQTLVNQYVFRGVVSNGGAVGVLKEQSTCLAAAQLQLVLPASNTMYVPPAPAPDPDDLLEQQCARLPRGCEVAPDPTTP